MAKATYWHKGEVLDYTPAADHAAGDIVSLGTRVGVIGETVKAGEPGHVHVVGVYWMPKAAGALKVGDAVYFSEADGTVSATAAGGIPAGYAAAAAADADTEVLVKLPG